MEEHNDLRPNILYIFSDQHAARVLGCEGDPVADTPNLDTIAKDGIRFSRAYCPSPVCLPSRMSMLTGLRPHEQTCWTNDDILDSGRPTWVHGLGAAGYRPVLIGRMHALGPDQLRGYVNRPIGDHSPNWPGVARRSLGVLQKTSGPFRESIEKSGPGQSSYRVMDQDVVEGCVAFLEDHAASKDDGPFCLTASFMLPHPPYVSDPEDFASMNGRVGPPDMPHPPNAEHPWIREWRKTKGISDVSITDILCARTSYYALVRELDRNVGRLLATLEDTGLAENTLVIYVSDHGDHIGERGLFWKHTLYEESIRVPLLMRWPGHIKPGRVVSDPVETGGLGNTILSLLGAPPLPNATMHSFTDLVLGCTRNEVQPIYVEYCTDDMPAWAEGYAVQQRAVISGRYKLQFYNGYPSQLFDLERDPKELTDLSKDPGHAGTLQSLLDLVTQEWDPDAIAETIKRRKADKFLLKAWAEQTNPTEHCRWDLRAEQNYLLGHEQS